MTIEKEGGATNRPLLKFCFFASFFMILLDEMLGYTHPMAGPQASPFSICTHRVLDSRSPFHMKTNLFNRNNNNNGIHRRCNLPSIFPIFITRRWRPAIHSMNEFPFFTSIPRPMAVEILTSIWLWFKVNWTEMNQQEIKHSWAFPVLINSVWYFVSKKKRCKRTASTWIRSPLWPRGGGAGIIFFLSLFL